MLSLVVYISILVIVFAGVWLTAKDPFKFLGGAIIYAIFGFYALHQGGIVGRHGHILPDITGGYFTIAILATFFLAALFLLKFVVALKGEPPSTSIRLLRLLMGKQQKR